VHSIENKITKNKKIILEIILAPITVYIANIIIITLFRLGNYLGTFLRNLYYIVVCLK
jgi:hypothetical protein